MRKNKNIKDGSCKVVEWTECTIEKLARLRGQATKVVDIEKIILRFKPSMVNSVKVVNKLVSSCIVNKLAMVIDLVWYTKWTEP